MAKTLNLTCPNCKAKKKLDVTEGIPRKTVCPGCKKPFAVEQFVKL